MRIRRLVKVAFPLAGTLVVFGAILLVPPSNVQVQVVLALVGILMIEAGVWKLTDPFLPNDREFTDLRDEVDVFIDLVRNLNDSARKGRDEGDPEAWERYRTALEEMHRSVDRMGELAGKRTGTPPTTPPGDGT